MTTENFDITSIVKEVLIGEEREKGSKTENSALRNLPAS